jgi:hypothetical protein
VWLVEAASSPRRALGRGPVRDLRFRPGGELLAATDRGLFAVAPDGRVRFLRLGSGRAGRARRLAVSGEAVAAGTEEGVFLARDGVAFARLDAGVAGGPIDALALRPKDDGFEIWTASGGSLQRARVRALGDGTLETLASTPAIGDGPAARSALDVAVDLAGAEVAVLSPEHVALLRAGAWQSVALELPPGDRARRLGAGAGRLWIATDGGVVWAERWEGPWRRAAPPAGRAPTFALSGAGERMLALGARGLLVGVREEHAVAASVPAAAALSQDDYLWRLRSEPSIRQVHGAALAWLALGPERMRSLERRADRRGWLPEVEVRGGAGRGRSLRFFDDQTQSSGVVYDLRDREFDRGSEYDGALVLRWDLGDLVYQPEAIDVAREAREVIELRDEVLDEVNQLYFERRRVLLERSLLPDPASPEAERLALRARELAAGLDAWTGGWWSRQVEPFSPRVTDPEEERP